MPPPNPQSQFRYGLPPYGRVRSPNQAGSVQGTGTPHILDGLVWGNLFTHIARPAPSPAPEAEPPVVPPKRKAPTKPKKLATKLKV